MKAAPAPSRTQPDGPTPAGRPDPSDEELVERYRTGHADAAMALIARYRRLVYARARRYFLPGADLEDLVQEGLVGLVHAIRGFRANRSSFATFATLCITRSIQSAVKQGLRRKHEPLNEARSFGELLDPADIERWAITTPAYFDLADQIAAEEEDRELLSRLWSGLSSFELDVLRAYLGGADYREIARDLGRTPKAVDNALQRIKQKLATRPQEVRA